MREAPVRGIGLRLLVEGTLPRVLHAQAGGDHEDLAQRLLRPGLQHHAPNRRIDREAGQLPAQWAQCN